MKTKNRLTTLAVMTALIIASLTAKPNTISGTGSEAIETEKTIKDYFKFPQIVIPVNESQKVEVLFTTNKSGQVNFVLAKTLEGNLKNEIEKQFLKLNLSKVKCDVVHSVILNLKTV